MYSCLTSSFSHNLSILYLNCFGRTIVPGSTVIDIGLKPSFLARISEKLLSVPPEVATTATGLRASSKFNSLEFSSSASDFESLK